MVTVLTLLPDDHQIRHGDLSAAVDAIQTLLERLLVMESWIMA
jgi:hypothetical protein